LRALILDASIPLGWMLDRPIPARSDLARKLIIGGHWPVVRLLWRHEVANAVLIAQRRGRITGAQAKTLMADLSSRKPCRAVATIRQVRRKVRVCLRRRC